MDIEEIEELINWNLSFDIPIHETLKELNKLDLLEYFISNNIIIKK